MHHIIAIRKSKGPTSHDIVTAIRRITGEQCVGHAGTLDPMAEGVLVIGIGRPATKQLASIVRGAKEYLATVRFGATSNTDDAEGTVVETLRTTFQIPRQTTITPVLQSFIGRIQQIPPQYSAVKVRGKPAHRRVRSGENIVLAARTVEITTLEVLRYAWPDLQLRIVCGPGVYIRALARDLGAALHVGGYLIALERTRVGTYTLHDALTVEECERRWRHSPA